MSTPSRGQDGLEQWVDRTLHGLPQRRAPQSLHAAVLAEIARRAALPWWRRNFAQWPMAVRSGFVLMCVALAATTVLLGHAHGLANAPAAWAAQANAALSSASGLAAWVFRLVPPAWLYVGLATGAMLYALLFGLGAIAYRTLYLPPSKAGDRA